MTFNIFIIMGWHIIYSNWRIIYSPDSAFHRPTDHNPHRVFRHVQTSKSSQEKYKWTNKYYLKTHIACSNQSKQSKHEASMMSEVEKQLTTNPMMVLIHRHSWSSCKWYAANRPFEETRIQSIKATQGYILKAWLGNYRNLDIKEQSS